MRLQLLLLLALAYIAKASATPFANGASIRDVTRPKILTEDSGCRRSVYGI